MHAKKTENYLTNKRLTEAVTIVESANILGKELKPDNKPQDAAPEYRISLAQCLLYKVSFNSSVTAIVVIFHRLSVLRCCMLTLSQYTVLL